MNRLGLFKRAAGLLAAPTFVSFPAQPVWQTAGVPEPPLPSPGFMTSFASQGVPAYNNAAAVLPFHTHPVSHCPMCLRREGHTH